MPVLANGNQPDIRPNMISKTIVLGHGGPYFDRAWKGDYLTPGDYTVELAVADGCSIVRTRYTFKVACSNCAPRGVISLNHEDDTTPRAWWRNDHWDISDIWIYLKPFDDVDENAIGNSPFSDYFLQELPQSPYKLVRIDGSDGNYKDYMRYFEGSVSWRTLPDNVTTMTGYNKTSTSDVGPPLQRPIANSDNNEQFFYARTHSVENIYEIQTITQSVSVKTVIPNRTICLIEVGSDGPEWGYFEVYSTELLKDCMGRYNFSATVYDECPTHNVTDSLVVELGCETMVARLKCHDNRLNYSHTTNTWPPFHLDARDSYSNVWGTDDLSGYTFRYWGLNDVICGTQNVPCSLGGGPGTTSVVYTPLFGNRPRMGKALVSVNLTNGCHDSSDVLEIDLQCVNSDQISAKINYGGPNVAASYDYTNQAFVGNQLFGVLSTYVGYSGYLWSLKAHDTPEVMDVPIGATAYTGLPSLYPQLSGATTVNATVTPFFPGTYDISLALDGGCKLSTAVALLTITCANDIDLHWTSTAYSMTYGDVSPLVITTSATTATAAAPLPSTFPRYWFSYNPPQYGFGSIATSGGGVDLTIPAASLPISVPVGQRLYPDTLKGGLWMNDGRCKWKQTNFTVNINCPPQGVFIPVFSTSSVPYTQSPFLVAYKLEYKYYGSLTITHPIVGYTGFTANVTAPYGSTYYNSAPFTTNTTITPDVPGTYKFVLTFNDGCGNDYTQRIEQTVTLSCADTNFATFTALTSATSMTFDDKQTVRLEAKDVSYGTGYDAGAVINKQWTITSAPSDSVYYPWSGAVELFDSNYTVVNDSWTSGNDTYYRKTTTVSEWRRSRLRVVSLDLLNDNTMSIWPTCFRPDVGGSYTATLTLQLRQSQCFVSKSVTVSVTCGTPPDISKVANNMIVPVDRQQPTRVWLNASGLANEASLTYSWRVLYPNIYSYNPIEKVFLTIPDLLSPRGVVSSFWVPQSNIDYIIELSVSDACHTVTKNFTVSTPCNLAIPLDNKTLAAYYDGQVPVTLMSFAYDHTQEIGNYLTYPKCQRYTWELVDYSSSYSASLMAVTEAEFVKTSGFAGLISAVVIVAILVPIIIWMYCTKKACFNKTDPRV